MNVTKKGATKIVHAYRKLFEQKGIDKVEHPADSTMISKKAGLEHCHWLLDVIDELIKQHWENHNGTVWMLLGFIKGQLWGSGLAEIKKTSIEEIVREDKKTT